FFVVGLPTFGPPPVVSLPTLSPPAAPPAAFSLSFPPPPSPPPPPLTPRLRRPVPHAPRHPPPARPATLPHGSAPRWLLPPRTASGLLDRAIGQIRRHHVFHGDAHRFVDSDLRVVRPPLPRIVDHVAKRRSACGLYAAQFGTSDRRCRKSVPRFDKETMIARQR